jgi:hypothetical protein
MRREITVAVLAIQLALSSSIAEAAYNKDQLQELNELLDRGNIAELIEFWNRNIGSFSRSSPVENMLADLMADIRENGIGQISSDLRDASDRAVSIY